jgi:hypothetical protein
MIIEFKDDYKWLSNFEPVKIIYNELEFPSVEHAYQSAKGDDEEWIKFCSNVNNKAGYVKQMSKTIKLDKNWSKDKIKIMKLLLKQKFNKEPFKTKLLETGNEYIQEGNTWNDVFWGVDLNTNNGKNNLGKLIMDIRNELNNQ